MAVLLDPVVLEKSAAYPSATLLLDPTVLESALTPTAVLKDALVPTDSADDPIATLDPPVVFYRD